MPFGQPVLDTTTTQSNVKTAKNKTKLSYKTKNTKKVGGGGGVEGEDRVIDRRQKHRQTGSNGETVSKWI